MSPLRAGSKNKKNEPNRFLIMTCKGVRWLYCSKKVKKSHIKVFPLLTPNVCLSPLLGNMSISSSIFFKTLKDFFSPDVFFLVAFSSHTFCVHVGKPFVGLNTEKGFRITLLPSKAEWVWKKVIEIYWGVVFDFRSIYIHAKEEKKTW